MGLREKVLLHREKRKMRLIRLTSYVSFTELRNSGPVMSKQTTKCLKSVQAFFCNSACCLLYNGDAKNQTHHCA